jgi:hypothetical protein
MVLLALVGGVLSDAFDRRRLMIWVQVYFVVVASMGSLDGVADVDNMPLDAEPASVQAEISAALR